VTERPPITPDTKVAELLEAYPDVEPVLIAAAPAFSRLTNPVLRRTIARVTSLKRAAEVAGLPVRDLVTRLRSAAGLPADLEEAADENAGPPDGPAPWVDAARVRWTIDADSMLESGHEPMSEVMRRTFELGADDLGMIRSSFRPAPLIELLEGRGFRTAVVRSGNAFATFIGRRPDG
jgi:hypothetical protein